MFYFRNDTSNLIYLFMGIGIVVFFAFFYFKKIKNQFRLSFFGDQVRVYFCEKRFNGTFRAYPLPHNMRNDITLSETAFNSLINYSDGFWKNISCSYLSGEQSWFNVVFVDSNTAITFYKSGQPFVKRCVSLKSIAVTEVIFFNLKRLLGRSDLMNNIFAYLSSFEARAIFIMEQSFKLLFFYKAMWNDIFAKIFKIIGIEIPAENSFIFTANFSVNGSTKSFFKKSRNFFIGIVQPDFYRTTRCQGNASLGIKKTSVVFHILTLWLKISLPATTKFDGTRINSSLCHSLNS